MTAPEPALSRNARPPSAGPLEYTPRWWQPERWARWHAVRIMAERGFIICCAVLVFCFGFLFGLVIAINHYQPQ